jgi:hypothetical protein
MGLPQFAYETFEALTCGECGIVFCVPRGWSESRREDHKGFYCPNGHCRAFVESDKDRDIKAKAAEIERLRKQLAWNENSLKSANNMVEEAHRSNASLRGVIAKEKKRVGNGVCPCCKRTFSQLQRHMECKHPAYKSDGGETK